LAIINIQLEKTQISAKTLCLLINKSIKLNYVISLCGQHQPFTYKPISLLIDIHIYPESFSLNKL